MSLVGSGTAFPVLQLTAVLLVGASAHQIGLLVALGSLPSLLLGLLAGVWVDRHKRRWLLIMADLGRFLLFSGLMLSVLFGKLNIMQLYASAFLAGFLTLISDIAYRAYLPSLVQQQELLKANSRFEVSQSATESLGPGIASLLLQFLVTPLVLAGNAFIFLAAAVVQARITDIEPALKEPPAQQHIFREIGEGLQLVKNNRYLRTIVTSISIVGLFYAMLETVLLLHLTRDLGLAPGWLSLIFASGAIGFLLAARATQSMTIRWGLGATLISAVLMLGLGNLVLSFTSGPPFSLIVVLMIGYTLFGFGHTAYNITQVSLRQALTPDHLQGRMNAIMEFALWGIAPLGALVGGLLGEYINLRAVIALTAAGELLGVLWLYCSPIRTLAAHLPTASAHPEQLVGVDDGLHLARTPGIPNL